MSEQVSDAILLERYVNRREEAAFVALVERHGPRVEGICRRVLHNEHDVEDISQATFFVLARKAARIAWRDSVEGWLSSVAHRLALGARSDSWRQQQRETACTNLARARAMNGLASAGRLAEKHRLLADPADEIERSDQSRVLHEELSHLPDKYREPVMLCDLEGRTHEQAAQHLGWPAGSMSRRLERARALLRQRLVQRGVTLLFGLVGMTLAFFGTWSVAHRSAHSSVSIRQAMVPLAGERPGMRSLLVESDESSALPDRAGVTKLAEDASRIAAEIESYDPGRNQDVWRSLAAEMHRWADLLAQATHEDDRTSMILAARRLDASCVNCHDLFREPAAW